jgi:hypothetical protein
MSRRHEAPDESVLFLRAGLALGGAVLLLALTGCASFSDGSGQTSKWGHRATYAESCRFESGGCPTLRSRLSRVPGLGWLFKPGGLGPCLPTTDQGPPQPCDGWPSLSPGAHALGPQQKAPPPAASAAARDQGGAPSVDFFGDGHCPTMDLLGLDADCDAAQALAAGVPPR